MNNLDDDLKTGQFGNELLFERTKKKDEFNFLSGVQENLSLYQIYEKYEINIQAVLQKYLANSVLSYFSVINLN